MPYAFILVICLASSLLSQNALGVNYSVLAQMTESMSSTGDRNYSVSVLLRDTTYNFRDDEKLALIAPTGQRTEESITRLDQVASLYSDLDRDEAGNFAGLWTIEEKLPGLPTNLYQFSIPEPSSWIFPQIPVITTPESDSVVGRVFDVKWMNSQANRYIFGYDGLVFGKDSTWI